MSSQIRLQQLELKMHSELPAMLQQLQDLQQRLADTLPADAVTARRELVFASHRLRGRAAMLQLAELCAAAATVEQLAANGAAIAAIADAMRECCRTWAEASA